MSQNAFFGLICCFVFGMLVLRDETRKFLKQISFSIFMCQNFSPEKIEHLNHCDEKIILKRNTCLFYFPSRYIPNSVACNVQETTLIKKSQHRSSATLLFKYNCYQQQFHKALLKKCKHKTNVIYLPIVISSIFRKLFLRTESVCKRRKVILME